MRTLTFLFFLGASATACAGVINDVPSCYQANKIAWRQPAPATELFIAVDQTTPLDDKLKQQVLEVAAPFIRTGNAYSLFTFSAYNQGHYLEAVTRGQIESPLPEAQRDDTGAKVLRQFDACLAGQQRFAAALLVNKLKTAMNGASDNLAKSDVIASVKEISTRVAQSPAKERVVLLVSDMLENSSISSFYAKHAVRKIDPSAEMAKVEANQLLGQFANARVYVIGGGLITENGKQYQGVYRDPKTMKALTSFWQGYVEKSGGKLVEFGQPALLNAIH